MIRSLILLILSSLGAQTFAASAVAQGQSFQSLQDQINELEQALSISEQTQAILSSAIETLESENSFLSQETASLDQRILQLEDALKETATQSRELSFVGTVPMPDHLPLNSNYRLVHDRACQDEFGEGAKNSSASEYLRNPIVLPEGTGAYFVLRQDPIISAPKTSGDTVDRSGLIFNSKMGDFVYVTSLGAIGSGTIASGQGLTIDIACSK